MNVSRKDFLKLAGAAAATAAAGGALGETAVKDTQKMERAKVYFSKVIDAEHLNKLYDLIKGEITGKVGATAPTSCRARW